MTQITQIQPQQRAAVDYTTRWIALGATAVSIAAFVYFFRQGVVVGYGDAASHLQIARRVIDSPTAGFAQLGSVWLPLQHLLMLPLVWITPLFYTGIAGSVVSMVSYVIACVFLYKTVQGLTDGNRLAAIAGTLIFALNPNVLYMQSIPMTELLFFATTAATVYYMQAWIQTERKYYLFAAAFACALGTLTRYEAWLMPMIGFTAIVVIVALRRYDRGKVEGSVLVFMFIAWAPVIGWVGWNWLIMGDPLYFQLGEYATSSLWVDPNDPSVGDVLVAAKTYWYALMHNLGLPVLIAMLIGIVTLIVTRRRIDTLPILSLLSLPMFFTWAVLSGTRPMNVMETSGVLYNLRFGLVAVMLAAVVIGYVVSLLPTVWQPLSTAVAAVLAFGVVFGGLVTVQETKIGVARADTDGPRAVSVFLREHYDKGLILQESFDNETILFHARISLANNVYEGSYQMWEPALAYPATNNIKWIVMRGGDRPDKVYTALHNSPQLQDYRLVYQDNGYLVYERTSA
jgi:hypothetical protein